MQKGKASLILENPPRILETASVAGKKEGEGPLGSYFDQIERDDMFGQNTWEKAESALQHQTILRVLQKSGLHPDQIRYSFGGDLLNQLIATSFGIKEFEIPIFGLYGACSTFGEGLSLAAMTVAAGYADSVLVSASSHYASAERQFRFPLIYGNQRPLSSTRTVTGCGAVILQGGDRPEHENGQRKVFIRGITTGRIVDMGVRDSMNMGAAMAMAAVDTVLRNFDDLGVSEKAYDRIITGDLGETGKALFLANLRKAGYEAEDRYSDCGCMIYDGNYQDTHSGGSGAGCAATVFSGYLMEQLRSGRFDRILFLPTGALHSQVSFQEGLSIPGICHGLVIETEDADRRW